MTDPNLCSPCPERVRRRMEKRVLQASAHPAMQHPFRYSLDTSKHLMVLLVVSLLTLLTWNTYIKEPSHAIAPTEDTLIGHILSSSPAP